MRGRLPTVALVIVLTGLTGGFGALAWTTDQHRQSIERRIEENQQLRRDLNRAQRELVDTQDRVATMQHVIVALASDGSLASRVSALEDSVGSRPLGYNARSIGLSLSIWDELSGLSDDVAALERRVGSDPLLSTRVTNLSMEVSSLRSCVNSIVSAIRFNLGFISC